MEDYVLVKLLKGKVGLQLPFCATWIRWNYAMRPSTNQERGSAESLNVRFRQAICRNWLTIALTYSRIWSLRNFIHKIIQTVKQICSMWNTQPPDHNNIWRHVFIDFNSLAFYAYPMCLSRLNTLKAKWGFIINKILKASFINWEFYKRAHKIRSYANATVQIHLTQVHCATAATNPVSYNTIS